MPSSVRLFGPGEVAADALDLPPLTGSVVIAVAAQLLAAVVYPVQPLPPDPLAVVGYAGLAAAAGVLVVVVTAANLTIPRRRAIP